MRNNILYVKNFLDKRIKLLVGNTTVELKKLKNLRYKKSLVRLESFQETATDSSSRSCRSRKAFQKVIKCNAPLHLGRIKTLMRIWIAASKMFEWDILGEKGARRTHWPGSMIICFCTSLLSQSLLTERKRIQLEASWIWVIYHCLIQISFLPKWLPFGFI